MVNESKSDEVSSFDEFREPSFAEKLGFLRQPENFATKAIHTGLEPGHIDCSSMIPLINLTSTYKLADAHNPKAYQYSRFGNPTRNALESSLAALDNAKFAVTFSSGLGAQTAIISSLKRGDGILVDRHVNLPTIKLLNKFAVNMDMEVKLADFNDKNSLDEHLKPNLKLVWFETPSMPSMKIIDIKAIADFFHEKSEAKVVVDNTTLSSYLQRPLGLGADIVIYSITKYMHGHSDVVMGSLAINDDKVHEKLKYHQGATGIIPSPFDCFMVNRSLKTLSLRMDHHLKTAVIVAKWLEKHPKVERVLHPALPSHSNHAIALSQSYGHSGVFSFAIRDASLTKVEQFLRSLKVFMLVESPCGFESFMRSPVMTNYKDLSEEQLKDLNITEGLVNVSIGLEDAEDLVNDIKEALREI